MCSRILFNKDGQPILVGRNEDWFEDLQTKVYVFPRGMKRDGAVDENPATWTCKYGSVVGGAAHQPSRQVTRRQLRGWSRDLVCVLFLALKPSFAHCDFLDLHRIH